MCNFPVKIKITVRPSDFETTRMISDADSQWKGNSPLLYLLLKTPFDVISCRLLNLFLLSSNFLENPELTSSTINMLTGIFVLQIPSTFWRDQCESAKASSYACRWELWRRQKYVDALSGFQTFSRFIGRRGLGTSLFLRARATRSTSEVSWSRWNILFVNQRLLYFWLSTWNFDISLFNVFVVFVSSFCLREPILVSLSIINM